MYKPINTSRLSLRIIALRIIALGIWETFTHYIATSYEPPASDDDSNQLIEGDGENKELIYELDDLEEIVAVHFQEEEGEEHNNVQFSVMVELSDELVHEIDQNIKTLSTVL